MLEPPVPGAFTFVNRSHRYPIRSSDGLQPKHVSFFIGAKTALEIYDVRLISNAKNLIFLHVDLANDFKKRIDVLENLIFFAVLANVVFYPYGTDEQSESILRLADWIVAHGIEGPGNYRAARDLLLRNSPGLVAGQSLSKRANETVVQLACRVGSSLDSSFLPIQGPPGAGKTFTGAHMICALVDQGKKVGVTAVSHKVIRKLLEDVVTAASEMNVGGVICAHRKEGADSSSRPVREIGSNEEALQSLGNGGVNVLGGTSWLWCREEFSDSVHVLFVDEAARGYSRRNAGRQIKWSSQTHYAVTLSCASTLSSAQALLPLFDMRAAKMGIAEFVMIRTLRRRAAAHL